MGFQAPSQFRAVQLLLCFIVTGRVLRYVHVVILM